MKRLLAVVAAVLLVSLTLGAASRKDFQLKSPDGILTVNVNTGAGISYSVFYGKTQILKPSSISMTLMDGTVYGRNAKVKKDVTTSVDQILKPSIYKKAEVRDQYNELSLRFKEFDLVFRAYDDGVAYRFISKADDDFEVRSEECNYVFPDDWTGFFAYSNISSPKTFEEQYDNSFENIYAHVPLAKFESQRLAFLPVTMDAPDGIKVCITEADLLDYPGMFLNNPDGSNTLKGVWAPYPSEVKQGGHNMLEGLIINRAKYIAKFSASRKSDPIAFPWRVMNIVPSAKDLTNSDLVYKLATPAAEGEDFSWVKPGKVAWDWWNAWNLYGVDFVSGINNQTYKYYIDFASKHDIEYVILDEGWAVNKQADLFQVVPEIDLKALVSYAKSKNVGLILWAGYWAFNRDIEQVCKYYSELGIKGFKVDFMNRDDQQMVEFYQKVASTAARYHMLIDFHGAFKPAGLQKTYPNVLNFEGVHGLEQMKWSKDDQVTYDVSIPFIRMVAGSFDYTQGAMRNAIKANYFPCHEEPMSQGTRCRQLAEYVIFDAPLTMMCDSPSNYMREPACTDFISAVPTVWDETVALDGEISEYVAMARRSGDTWYVGAMTDWSARDMTLDLGFLGEGNYTMEIFKDGVNADKVARDFATQTLSVPADRHVTIHMAPGGGWAAKIVK